MPPPGQARTPGRAGTAPPRAARSAPAPTRLRPRTGIDGLRAIAILPVLAFHAFPRIAAGGFVVAVSAFGHLLLDSIVGDIWWFAPAVDQPFSLLSVRPQWQPWWLNFLLHPVMVLELAIIAVAVRVARRPRAGTGVSPDAADVRRDRR